MYNYEFVSAKLGKPFGNLINEHRRVIRTYARKGYRYVGYIPTEINEEGVIEKVDLVFEIPSESSGAGFSKQSERLGGTTRRSSRDV